MISAKILTAGLLSALAIAPSMSLAAKTVTIVRNGKSEAVIHAPASVMQSDLAVAQVGPAQEAEKQRQRLRASVQDLALYFEKMSGARMEIVTNAPAADEKRTVILIGEPAIKQFGPPAKSYPFKQGFRVVVSDKGGKRVGLLGESDLAASYAIYEVLDRLGCRWFMPSDLGEVIPQQKTIELETLDFSSTPGTICRGVWYADDAYRRRNRHGGLILAAGHALEMYITAEDRTQHPEWKATVDGKPSAHRLKWSNPDLAQTLGDRIIAYLDTYHAPSVSLSPDDGLGFDNSPEDKALDAGDIDPVLDDVSITDRLLVFCRRIIDRVNSKYPDKLYGMLAYANYLRPPLREKVPSNLVPQIAPITYSRAHPMNDDNVPGNKILRNAVEGWGKKAKMTSYYFYGWFLAEPVAPNPMLAKWGHDVPYVLDKGNCKFWQPETQPNFETSMHCLYMGCRLAWNPKLKPEEVYQEINEKFYGQTVHEMTAYWNYIDDVWTKTNDYSGCGFGYLRRWTPEKLKGARELMNAALSAAKTDTEKFRVGLAADSLKLFESFMKLRYEQADGRFANLAADATAWRKEINRLGAKYAAQFTFTRMGPTQILSEGYFAQFYEQTYKDASRIANEAVVLTSKPIRLFKYQADAEKKGEAGGFAKVDFNDKDWKTTDVLVETWSTLGYHDYFKSMWYRASVDVPAVPEGKKVFLWVGSTDGSVKVFVNGQHIPHLSVTEQPDKSKKTETLEAANGYCQPFSFDITSAVKPGAANQIALFCTRTFFNELGTGGLIGPVALYRDK
jgi:hypothetical protein